MNVLVDAQAMIWAADSPAKLTTAAANALEDPANTLWVSSGTVWEICIKVGLGKLELNRPLREWINVVMTQLQAELLPITVEHAVQQSDLPFHHRDPFDRLVVAQALHEDYGVVSADAMLDRYGIKRIW